ncbi:2Fe-2S iron-sulfur cluster-binding protein [Campylobacter jejuni]
MIRYTGKNSALSFAFYQKNKRYYFKFTVSCQSAICGACAVRVNGILILLVILKCKIY